jgi:hypothetical protein
MRPDFAELFVQEPLEGFDSAFLTFGEALDHQHHLFYYAEHMLIAEDRTEK